MSQSVATLSRFGMSDRVVVVTGAGRGVGRSVCELFAATGARIVAADIDGDAAENTAAAVRASGGQATAVRVDISDEASVKSMVGTAEATYGRIDSLIHAAAIFPKKPLLELSVEQWDRVQSVNLRGSFLCLREVLASMVKAGIKGTVVNVSSVSGERAVIFHNAAYSSSKAGLTNLTRVVALEFASHGIRCNAVLPGAVATEGAALATAAMRESGMEIKGPLASPGRMPLGRAATPEEIANACLFLASDAAAYITGQSIAVDGGFQVS